MTTRFELLADWIDGRLDPEHAASAEALLKEGPASRAAVAWLREFKRAAGRLPLEDPPPIVGQRLRQYFAQRHDGITTRPLPELPAELMFDSRRDLVPAGMRAAGTIDQTIQVAYHTDRADLVVDIHRLGRGRNRLDGQLLPIEPGGATIADVTARGAGVELSATDGDALGRFCLPDVGDGQYELRASNGEFVVVAEITIESTRPDRPATVEPGRADGPEPADTGGSEGC